MLKKLSILFSMVLFGCSTATDSNEGFSKQFELTDFYYFDKEVGDSINLQDSRDSSYIRFSLYPNDSLSGDGLLSFSRWPGQAQPDGTETIYWIYKGVCSTFNECQPGQIAGWYHLTNSSKLIKLYLRSGQGEGSWLDRIEMDYISAEVDSIQYIAESFDLAVRIRFVEK